MRSAVPIVLLAACTEGLPPPPVSQVPSSPPPASATAPVASASAAAPPRRPSPIVTFASFTTSGVEARLAAESLRVALPAVRACAEGADTGWLQVSFDVRADGSLGPATTALDGAEGPSASVRACVERAFAGVVVDGAKKAGARASIWISFAPADAAALPAFDASAELVRERDGSCAAIAPGPDCPPNKICEAPERVRARCPEDRGLPPRPDGASASRAVSVSVSGGKTGQGAEELALHERDGACAASKRRTKVPSGDPTADAPELEVVDVPCADVEAAFALAKKHFATLRPKGREGVSHAVRKVVSFSTRAKPGAALTVTAASWVGPDEPGDARFDEVARAASRAVKGRGTLALARLSP